jgi:D-serine/D-alanine/glycine transporter
MPLARVLPWVVLAFFAYIVVTLSLAEDTRIALLCTPIWFVALAVMWQLRKRALLREGKPLTSAIELPGTGEDAKLSPEHHETTHPDRATR